MRWRERVPPPRAFHSIRACLSKRLFFLRPYHHLSGCVTIFTRSFYRLVHAGWVPPTVWRARRSRRVVTPTSFHGQYITANVALLPRSERRTDTRSGVCSPRTHKTYVITLARARNVYKHAFSIRFVSSRIIIL